MSGDSGKQDKVFVHADKTRNVYLMSPHDYEKLLNENITNKYKTAPNAVINDIAEECESIAEQLDISDRVDCTTTKPAFVTLKDHKENFRSKPQVRLINPTKPELGRVSKRMLDRINTCIKAKTNLNQWTSTTDVLKWFAELQDKSSLTFVVFDIVDFYPSISLELLTNCLTWAKKKSPQ